MSLETQWLHLLKAIFMSRKHCFFNYSEVLRKTLKLVLI